MKMGQRHRLRPGFWCLGLLLLVGACAPGAVIGLRPEYPPIGELYRDTAYDFVEVDSLQPTFRWEAFPRERDRAANKEILSGLTDVTYDLQIWRVETTFQYPAERVYAKRGLTATSHRIEQPLAPATTYSWTVRARFQVNGEPRVTEWAMSGWGVRPLQQPLDDPFPSPRFFRFMTPAR